MSIKLSVIIPVHNGGENLRRCLDALAASTRPPDQVIVVDDASTDGSGDVARQAGAQVIRLDGSPHGPACARNRGAEAAEGDALVFLDADVAVHPDTLARMERALDTPPSPPLEGGIEGGIAALFGSYDDDPPTPGLVARYKNLLHHYVHQHGRRQASTFWAGCGAIRREAFQALGGFDEGYTRPSIEDIELGARLRRAGQRIWLCPDIQVAHLKRWTFVGLLRSDILDRAVPWTRLILRDRRLPADLNVDVRGRLGALAAWGLVIGLALGCWWPPLWAGALLMVLALILLNADLYRFFARRGGIRFAVGAAGLHTLYLLYSSLVFAGLLAGHILQDRSRRILLLLLIVTLLKGWLWSVVVPVWQANDEDQHFGYAQEVARQRAWPVAPPSQVTEERAVLWQLFYLWGQRGSWAALSPAEQTEVTRLAHRLESPAVRTNLAPPVWFPTFVRQHPPLYYTLQAFVHDLGAEQNILVRMAWMRLLSVVMAVGAVACAYGAAHELWPDRPGWPVAAATLVSFQPLFTFFTSVVNNAALEILCFAALTWLAAIVARQGMSWRRGLILGGVLAAGLLTKSSFLAAGPVVALLWGWDAWRRRGRCHWGGWALAAGLPLLLAGWWYAGFIVSGGREMAGVYFSPRSSQPVPLWDYLWHYPWLTRYRPFMQFWWGLFGWGGVFYPAPLYTALEILTGLAFLGWLWRAWHGWRTRRGSGERGDALAVALGVGFTLAVIAFYTALGYQMAGYGSVFKVQARYFVAPVAAQLLALTVGWTALRRGRRLVLLTLSAGMVALNLYALLGVIAPRYYGPGDLLTLLERATVLQPISPALLLILTGVFLAATLALVVTLYHPAKAPDLRRGHPGVYLPP